LYQGKSYARIQSHFPVLGGRVEVDSYDGKSRYNLVTKIICDVWNTTGTDDS
jgi:hypothetical protein